MSTLPSKQVSSYINIATVYRTLELLKELEMVTDSDMGASATHYALRTHGPAPSRHLPCLRAFL